MSVNKQAREIEVENDDARLRYHLTSLYTLRPIPDDLLMLVREIGGQLERTQVANDGD